MTPDFDSTAQWEQDNAAILRATGAMFRMMTLVRTAVPMDVPTATEYGARLLAMCVVSLAYTPNLEAHPEDVLRRVQTLLEEYSTMLPQVMRRHGVYSELEQ